MSGEVTDTAAFSLWAVVGAAGFVLFYGRFYVQWIVSEIRKRSVVPVAFWYMSAAGSLLLLLYAFGAHQPMGALTQCFNIVIYTRNLNHIWKEQKSMSRRWRYGIQTVAAVLAVTAVAMVLAVWKREYAALQDASASEAARAVFWVVVLGIGQALYAARFTIQWVVTELRRKSVIPTAFWYISIVAAVLQTTAYLNSTAHEWLFAMGTLITIPPYVRNVILIHRAGPRADLAESS